MLLLWPWPQSVHVAKTSQRLRISVRGFADDVVLDLEDCMANGETWAHLARFRTRLLLGPIPAAADRNSDLKRRLSLWERGQFDELARVLFGQQEESRSRMQAAHDPVGNGVDEEEKQGRRTRLSTAMGAVSKAVNATVDIPPCGKHRSCHRTMSRRPSSMLACLERMK